MARHRPSLLFFVEYRIQVGIQGVSSCEDMQKARIITSFSFGQKRSNNFSNYGFGDDIVFN